MAGWRFNIFGKNIIELNTEERNSLENPSISLQDESAISEIFGITKNSINHDSALTLSAVWRAVNLLAGTIAYLPLNVYTRDTENNRDVDRMHPVSFLLKEPNAIDTEYKFVENLMTHLLLWGNSYREIVRNNNYEPIALKQHNPSKIKVVEYKDNLYYQVKDTKRTILSIDMIHVRGFGDDIIGKDPITVARESLENGLIMMKSSNRLFRKGHLSDRYVEVPGAWKEEQYKRFKDSFNQAYAGWENGGTAPILEGGAKIQSIATTPENMQFLQSRKFSISEVARWFGVPPHKLADLERSTNNNIEHQAIEFVTDTIMLYTERIEQEFTRKLLRNDEKATKWIEFNLNGLLRGDLKTRAEYYTKATGGRPWMTPDEVRKLENQKSKGGEADELITPLNFKAPDKNE
jgi:HK97 family phage portal protein